MNDVRYSCIQICILFSRRMDIEDGSCVCGRKISVQATVLNSTQRNRQNVISVDRRIVLYLPLQVMEDVSFVIVLSNPLLL